MAHEEANLESPEHPHVRLAAEFAHNINRAYCAALGEYQPPWETAPEWQKDSAIQGVISHFAALQQGKPLSPAHSHELWLAEKEKEGWKYGTVKDPEKKEHPCFVPYDQLPAEQKAKDYLFAAVCEAMFHWVWGKL